MLLPWPWRWVATWTRTSVSPEFARAPRPGRARGLFIAPAGPLTQPHCDKRARWGRCDAASFKRSAAVGTAGHDCSVSDAAGLPGSSSSMGQQQVAPADDAGTGAGCWRPHKQQHSAAQQQQRPGPWSRMIDNIASPLAFFPPSPASYTVEEHHDGSGELYVQSCDRSYPRVSSARVQWLLTSQGQRIVAALVPHQEGRGSTAAPLTLLYSHGNAVDLGQMLPVYRDLGRLLGVNVCGYDYSGYGASSGVPSISATCSDIVAVLEALEGVWGVPRSRVVLYGQSVGSGPTVWLAAQRPGVAGVVLHSPLLSGVRVFNPGLRFWPSWLDIYPNHLLVRRVDVPLLVMHGTADEVIDVSAGRRLAQLAPAAVEPLLAEGCDHHNVEACPQFLPRLRGFLGQLTAKAAAAAAAAASRGAQATGGKGLAQRP